ncbi:MAG TPA: matrixin family metalloprotease [Vicinamibacterales bacterium]
MTVHGRGLVAIVLAVVLTLPASPAHAYLHLSVSTSSGTKQLTWKAPQVRWYAADRSVPGVTASQFQIEVQKAFATWEAVPTASIAFQFVGFTSASPDDEDGLTVLGFDAAPDLERVLGATSFVIDNVTGEIVESDVFFNSIFTWSVSAAGDPTRFDLQSVATHEIGHVVGLGHSAIGETEIRPEGGRRVLGSGSVMFPISLGRGAIADRTLQPDDIAAVSDLYPDGGFADRTGALSGRVLVGGRGVLGAHVEAFSIATGAIVGGFALGTGGEFLIKGLDPGAYVVRVEPLDDGDIESFFAPEGVDINFQATFSPRLAVAPAGGASDRFDVTVRPK